MLEATPVSLLAGALGGGAGAEGSSREARGMLPSLCVVSAAEVLHHTYERPSSAWRLVVVDVRMRANDWALPVCVRLRQAQHAHRKQLLLEMPYEEQVHFCLMGDGAPVPGDDAYQLCRFLVGSKARRRHLSVVDGGWPAVEELARSLHLDLLPLDSDAWSTPGSEDATGAGGRGAGAPVERVAERAEMAIQVATEKAAVVGQKVAANAKNVWSSVWSLASSGAQWLDQVGGSAADGSSDVGGAAGETKAEEQPAESSEGREVAMEAGRDKGEEDQTEGQPERKEETLLLDPFLLDPGAIS